MNKWIKTLSLTLALGVSLLIVRVSRAIWGDPAIGVLMLIGTALLLAAAVAHLIGGIQYSRMVKKIRDSINVTFPDYERALTDLAAKDAEIYRLNEAQRFPIFEGKRLDNGETVWGSSIVQLLDDGVRTAYIPQYGEKCFCEHDETDNILAFERGTFYKVDIDTICIRPLLATPEKVGQDHE